MGAGDTTAMSNQLYLQKMTAAQKEEHNKKSAIKGPRKLLPKKEGCIPKTKRANKAKRLQEMTVSQKEEHNKRKCDKRADKTVAEKEERNKRKQGKGPRKQTKREQKN